MKFIFGMALGLVAVVFVAATFTRFGLEQDAIQLETPSETSSSGDGVEQASATDPASIQTDNEADATVENGIETRVVLQRDLPESLRLIVVETEDYRLTAGEIAQLPRSADIALWPDSAALDALDRRRLWLIAPAHGQEHGDYTANFDQSVGIYLPDVDQIGREPGFARILYLGLKGRDHALLVDQLFDWGINDNEISPTAVDIVVASAVLESNADLTTQWEQIMAQSQLGNALVVTVLFNGEFARLRDTIDATQ